MELVQENRDIRMKMEDYRSERNSIAQAKKALEERLQELSRHSRWFPFVILICSHSAATGNHAYSGAVELERDDLRKELESAKTSLAMAQARQTSAERLANEQQRNAAREREEAGKVANINVSLILMKDWLTVSRMISTVK